MRMPAVRPVRDLQAPDLPGHRHPFLECQPGTPGDHRAEAPADHRQQAALPGALNAGPEPAGCRCTAARRTVTTRAGARARRTGLDTGTTAGSALQHHPHVMRRGQRHHQHRVTRPVPVRGGGRDLLSPAVPDLRGADRARPDRTARDQAAIVRDTAVADHREIAAGRVTPAAASPLDGRLMPEHVAQTAAASPARTPDSRIRAEARKSVSRITKRGRRGAHLAHAAGTEGQTVKAEEESEAGGALRACGPARRKEEERGGTVRGSCACLRVRRRPPTIRLVTDGFLRPGVFVARTPPREVPTLGYG